MGPVNWLGVVLAAIAAFLVGAIYGALFGKVWQRAARLSNQQLNGSNMTLIFGATFLLELMSAAMLGHGFARLTNPAPHVKMMMAIGTAVFFVIPAIGVNYLFQRRSMMLFAIDAVHWILAYAAIGGVFVALS